MILDFHSLRCVYRDRLLIFLHIHTGKIFGSHTETALLWSLCYIGPRYNGVAVYRVNDSSTVGVCSLIHTAGVATKSSLFHFFNYNL